MAEGEGFEPPVPLRAHMISSHAHSTGLCHPSETGRRTDKAPVFLESGAGKLSTSEAPSQIRREAASVSAEGGCLIVEGLRKRFARLEVLGGATFRLEPGEVVGLVGANGAGKTTLLRMLAGCLPPDGGRVRLDGFDLAEHPVEVRRRLGYLPENQPVYPEMRVREYLKFRARLKGLHGATRRKRIREMLHLCGLRGLERAPMGRLSRGQVRRALLADALLGHPPLLLLDEPTAGLDEEQRGRTLELIGRQAGRRTVLMATHSEREAAGCCGRLVRLQDGRVEAVDIAPRVEEGGGVAGATAS